MGLSSAPNSLSEAVEIILNNVPVRNDKGEIQFEKGEDPNDPCSRALLQKAPLSNVIDFFDDIIIYSKFHPSDNKTLGTASLTQHFELVEAVVARMALYGFKLSVPKCTFAKTSIKYLGWYINSGVISADPSRIAKVKDFTYPTTRKQLMAFNGLINTLKRITPLTAGNYMHILLEPISNKKQFVFEDRHKQAFDKLKEILGRGHPL